MSLLAKLRSANARADRWLRDHVIVWWLFLAVVSGGAYALGNVVISDGAPTGALVLGTVFGAVFATVSILFKRWRRG